MQRISIRRTAASLATLAIAACSSVDAPQPPSELSARAADGVPLAWETRGNGAPTLVFVHGWCGGRELWRATMDALAPRHRVLALDLAGHGGSGARRESWTLDALAGDVVAVVEASGERDVVLVGHSMGAPVSLLAAPRLAPRVRGVIAVDGAHRADFAYPPGHLEAAARELEADFPGTVSASIRAALSPAAAPRLAGWLEARALRTDRAAAVGILRGLEGFELAPALAGAGVPVRVIDAADREPAPDVEATRRLADFDAAELQGVGHFPMLERPAEFLPLLERLVAEFPEPAAAR